MRNRKRWLAAVLMTALLFGDVGVVPSFAATEERSAEASVSDNDSAGEQTQEEEEEVDSGGASTDTGQADEEWPGAEESDAQESPEGEADAEETENEEETTVSGSDAEEFPALHIGQIEKGEELPDAEDPAFVYDLPISFEQSDSLTLFVNYSVGLPSGQELPEEEEGTLVWSILRGEKGMTAGSTSLVGEEDDWTGFETVYGSPYFTMTECEEESGRYTMAELTAREAEEEDAYDYYIRAAYYPGKGKKQPETFYAAATVPYRLQDDDADTVEAEEAAADGEDMQTDAVTDGAAQIIADDAADDMSADEDVDNADVEVLPEEEQDGTLPDGEDGAGQMEAAPDSETLEADADPVPAEGEGGQQETKKSVGVLTLSAESVTLHIGNKFPVSASIVPAETGAVVAWESSDAAVATVDAQGMITAVTEGSVRITAKYGDMTASAKVKVVPEDDIYDISGDIWVDGFQRESDGLVYTGQKITQDIRVYHKEMLLTEKTDYTLSYKNNVNAATYDAAKAPSVTIKLKGQYQGSVTLYFTIKPAQIESADIYSADDGADGSDGAASGYKQAVNYSKNLKLPSPELKFNKKKLSANKDFVCDYTTLQEELQQKDYKKGDSYEPGKVYHYTVKGIGNFQGSFPMQLVVLKDKNLNFSSASVKLSKKEYEYSGKALTKSEVTVEELKLNKQILEKKLYDYEVYAETVEGAYVMVYPTAAGEKEGYRGYKKVDLKLTGDRKISEAAPGDRWHESIVFSQKTVNEEGGIFQEPAGVLTFGEGKEALTEGLDYTVKYSNAKKAGQVTATFTGKGRYKGTLKKKYTILPNTDKSNFTIRWRNVTYKDGKPVIAYQKGGASPDFALMDKDGIVLKNKTDYTVKLKDNKTPGTDMSCEITGKGNYKGYAETVQLRVMAGEISRAVLTVSDKPYSAKQNAWKSSVTVVDVNGKKLSAGKDYEKLPDYTYETMASGQPPQAGSVVNVTVRGMGCYEGTVSGSYRIYANSIGKLVIVIDAQEYTGKEITLSAQDIHVYASNADKKAKRELENATSCYEITGYKNNSKAGTAKVTLRGKGEYGGTKTYSFKIQKKKYLVNRAEKVALDPTSLLMTPAEKRTLTVTLTPNMPEDALDNPTVIWSSSNSSIATVETTEIQGNRVTGTITAKKEGSVTITATAQDGGKKATCKLTIVDVPILQEAGQTITMEQSNVDRTYQLHLEWGEYQEQKIDELEWESSNPEIVSADRNGLLTIKKDKAGTVVIRLYPSNRKYLQQCYVVVKGEEKVPEGKVKTYEQKPGVTDDTPAINDILQEWEENPSRYDAVYIPAGVYHIDAVTGFGGIVLRDNQTLFMSPNALLMAIGNDSTYSRVIYAFGRDNITISGGQIVGERNEHTGKGGEWGHGIDIVGCTNVHISDMDISQCWGDGIYLGFYDGPDVCSDGVTIENCILHDNRRSNLSITDVSNVTIRNCQFNRANGTDPQYGIDIEPNAGRPCSNIEIYDSTFTGNKKGSLGIITPASNIRLENCTLDGALYNMAGKNVVLKNTTVKGAIVDRANGIKKEK